MENKPVNLKVGQYTPTQCFKDIPNMACVCFEDLGLVAVTGPADDQESQEYAELFAAAPRMYAGLKAIITRCDEMMGEWSSVEWAYLDDPDMINLYYVREEAREAIAQLEEESAKIEEKWGKALYV